MSLTPRDSKSPMPTGLRKPYPKGPKKQVTAEWKERVRARLVELGHDHRWLEAHIKGPQGRPVSRGMVTKLLGSTQSTSALVDAICDVLGLMPPMAEVSDPDEFTLLEGYRRMSIQQKRHLLGLLGLGDHPDKN